MDTDSEVQIYRRAARVALYRAIMALDDAAENYERLAAAAGPCAPGHWAELPALQECCTQMIAELGTCQLGTGPGPDEGAA
jgi:hypothetical protein